MAFRQVRRAGGLGSANVNIPKGAAIRKINVSGGGFISNLPDGNGGLTFTLYGTVNTTVFYQDDDEESMLVNGGDITVQYVGTGSFYIEWTVPQ